MQKMGAELGFAQIAYGMNTNDRRDYPPPAGTTEEHEVLAPLAEVRIRPAGDSHASRGNMVGYTLWDRPAAPCPYRVARGIRPHGDT